MYEDRNKTQPPPVVVVTKNADGIQTRTVFIDAVNRASPLPAMNIPDGMSVLIKAWPAPFNAGIVFVAESKEKALEMIHVVPLRPGEFVSYQIKDSSRIWVIGTVPGDRVTETAEKNGGK